MYFFFPFKENSTGIVMPEEKPKGKGKSKKRAADTSTAESTALALKDYLVEYSKSSRATCKHCEIKICKVISVLFLFLCKKIIIADFIWGKTRSTEKLT